MHLDGAMTLRSVGDLQARLLAALAAGDALTVDCTAVEDADIAFVQLLLAARREAVATGKRLLLGGTASGPLHEVLLRGGFVGTANDDAFWKGE
jgi:anti-anti-sigma regulatory factor